MRKLKVIGTLLFLLLASIVIFQNTEVVETRILFATFEMPRAALLATTLILGVIIGIVFATFGSRKQK